MCSFLLAKITPYIVIYLIIRTTSIKINACTWQFPPMVKIDQLISEIGMNRVA